jgi:response regulator RpfG family c-di-GMP phosphodiesterase
MTSNKPALLIDDDTSVLRGLRRALSAKTEIDVCASGEEAIRAIESGREFSVFICDYQMPGLNGIDTLEALRARAPSVPRILLTGHANAHNLREGVNRAEIFRIIEKPCSLAMLENAIYDATIEEARLKEKHRAIEKTVLGTILMLRDVLVAFGIKPGENRSRILALAHQIIGKTNFCAIWVIDAALILSDMDKLKETAMTGSGAEPIKAETTMFGPSILKHIPRMKPVAEALHFKEKNFDGSGFPANLISGDTIPPQSRLLRLLLEFEAQLDTGLNDAEAYKNICNDTKKFDPTLIKVLSDLLNIESDAGKEKSAAVEQSILDEAMLSTASQAPSADQA